MESKLTRLFLIRHAETTWNAAQVFQGHMDSTLTERGIGQATDLARRLASEEIAALYSSDLGRSVRTAQVIAGHLGLSAIPRADLREIDCGEWTGKSYEEVRTLWPERYADWKNRPHLHEMPGGESVAQVQERGLGFLEEIRRRHAGQNVCTVTHNSVVKSVLCHLLGWPLARLWEGASQPNCAINLIEFRGGKIELVEIANTDHLARVSDGGTSTSIA